MINTGTNFSGWDSSTSVFLIGYVKMIQMSNLIYYKHHLSSLRKNLEYTGLNIGYRDKDMDVMDIENDKPWVLLVLPNLAYSYLRILVPLTRRANVVTHFVDPWDTKHIIHRVPGKLLTKYKQMPISVIKLTSKLLNRAHEIRLKEISPEKIDLLFVTDPVVCKFNFKKFKNAVKVYWSHDSHLESTFYNHVYSTLAQEFDYVFCAHKQVIPKFIEFGAKAHWLAYACDPQTNYRMTLPMSYDISFVANIHRGGEREKIIKLLESLYNSKIFLGQAWQHDMSTIYNMSKIVLNISEYNELNWRIFEVLACGRCLLTNYSNEVTELFLPMKHLVTYGDKSELVDRIKYLLEHSEQREHIALEGQKEVYAKHTMDHRIKELLSITLGLK